MQTQVKEQKMTGVFGFIERAGNKVPNPVYLFIWLFVVTAVLSLLLSMTGITVTHPGTGKEITIVNMLSSNAIANFFLNAVKEFVNFAPLGMVIVATIGLGVANGSGLLKTSLKLAGTAKTTTITTAIVFLIGICGNIAGDAAFVIYPPLVALLFQGTGRNPLAGLFAGFASVACGFGANLLIGSADASLAGMTEAAARIIDPNYVASPAMGFYFLFASTLFLTPVGTWVTLKFVEPKLNRLGLGADAIVDATNISTELSPAEKKGLIWAGISTAVFFVVVALMTLPGLPFAAPEGKTVVTGPLLKSIPPLILFLFFIPGYVYGKIVGSIKTFDDAIKMMSNELKSLAGFLLICFFASQFIAVFRDSNIGLVVAIWGGNLLKNSGIQGPWLLALFAVMVAVVNLFIGSASAKYALLSTIFVPMLMIAGINPAATQAVYRIGDSITNNLTPTLPYLAIVLSYAQQYDVRAKTGTVLAYMFPYTLAFGLAWIVFLLIWLFAGLPMGPGYYGFL